MGTTKEHTDWFETKQEEKLLGDFKPHLEKFYENTFSEEIADKASELLSLINRKQNEIGKTILDKFNKI